MLKVNIDGPASGGQRYDYSKQEHSSVLTSLCGCVFALPKSVFLRCYCEHRSSTIGNRHLELSLELQGPTVSVKLTKHSDIIGKYLC